jgi:antitoxin StbD
LFWILIRFFGGFVMAHLILSNMSASFSELKKNPIGTVTAGGGLPIAILNRNQPAFYCVPAAAYEALLEKLDDRELNVIADQRLNDGQAFIRISLDEL